MASLEFATNNWRLMKTSEIFHKHQAGALGQTQRIRIRGNPWAHIWGAAGTTANAPIKKTDQDQDQLYRTTQQWLSFLGRLRRQPTPSAGQTMQQAVHRTENVTAR